MLGACSQRAEESSQPSTGEDELVLGTPNRLKKRSNDDFANGKRETRRALGMLAE